jgi:hypothetical protein
MSRILQERLSFDQAEMLIEHGEAKEGKPKSLYMKGIFIQGGVRNLNERVYPVSEIANAVDHVNDVIRGGESVLGECDHPDELTINLDRVSHVIEKMWMDGNSGFGKLKLLPTPKGEIIRTIIEAGCKLGVSSRGSGNVNDRGEVSDFEIITVDIVAKPSAQNAYPQPVYEALNSRRGRVIEDLATAVSRDPKAQKHLHKELLTWIDSLK